MLATITRAEHLQSALDEFAADTPSVGPLRVETVANRSWTLERRIQFESSSDWQLAAGVYILVDFCFAEDPYADSDSEQHSVIRRIGKAVRFGTRLPAYHYDKRTRLSTREYRHDDAELEWPLIAVWNGDEWFRYSQIDIVRTPSKYAELLERFLLQRIPTQENIRDTPKHMRGKPLIYDSAIGQ